MNKTMQRRRRTVTGIVGAVRVLLKPVDERRKSKKRIIPTPGGGGGRLGGVYQGVMGYSLLPHRPLTSHDITAFIEHYEIPHFRGVFMRDDLPHGKPWRNECMIINQDSAGNYGTHWTCLVKTCNDVFYFDSFGRLPPALEVLNYMHGCRIYYNTHRYQRFDTIICGHLCLYFLYEYYKNGVNGHFFI